MSRARNLGAFGGSITSSGDLEPTGPTVIEGVTEPMWFKDANNGNGILFDSSKQKRITWNDGAGNLTIRAGNYYNSGLKYVVAGDGAATISMASDGGDGNVVMQVATTGTNADDPVTYDHTFIMDADGTFTYDTYRIHNEGDEESWTAPTLLNSWVNYGGSYAIAGYRKAADGRIDVRGLIKSGVNGTVFTLPSGYRPSSNRIFNSMGSSGMIRYDISAAGTVFYAAGYSIAWQSLEISFYP
jgi:hypothetical protein